MIYLGNGMYSDSGSQNELMHYGVMGMKWGVRKSPVSNANIIGRRRALALKNDREAEGLKRRQAAAFKKARESDNTRNPFKIMTRMAIQQHNEESKIANNEKRIRELRDKMYNYHLPFIDQYHKNPKYRKKVNKFNGLSYNAHIRDDDNFEHDIIDNYLISHDKKYGELFEEQRNLYNENVKIKRLNE